MSAPTNDAAAPSVVDRSLTLRLFRRMAEQTPAELPTIISTFAVESDFEMLETVLKSGVVAAPPNNDERMALLASVFPILQFAADKPRARRLTNDWAASLGIATDVDSLSRCLVGLKSALMVEGLLAIGADPNHALEDGVRYLTPIGKALDRGYASVLPVMLDHLRKSGELPLHSFGMDPESNTRQQTRSLFDRVLTGLGSVRIDAEDCVVEYLGKHDLPDSWRRSIGEAFEARKGEYRVAYFGDSFRPLMDLLLLAKFDDPSQWRAALSGDRYMDAMVSNGGYFYKLGRIALAAASDGVDINSWRANWRHEGADYPLPLLVFAAKYGQALTVQRFLELGAETEFRMPSDNDTSGAPCTGPTFIEYAQKGGVKAPVQQVLASWCAQQAVKRVTSQGRAAAERVTP